MALGKIILFLKENNIYEVLNPVKFCDSIGRGIHMITFIIISKCC